MYFVELDTLLPVLTHFKIAGAECSSSERECFALPNYHSSGSFLMNKTNGLPSGSHLIDKVGG